MKHYYLNVKGWFNWPEMYARAVRLAPEKAIFVEIGCHVGRSTSCLGVEALNSGKKITIYAIDLWNPSNKIGVDVGVFEDTIRPINRAFIEGSGNTYVIPLKGDSGELHRQFKDGSVDFVWIDGNHRYDYVIKDIRSWWPKLKQGGWMGGDDLIHGGVRKAVEEFFGPECDAGSEKVGAKEGAWVRNQSATVHYGKTAKDVRPAGGGWVWWARSRNDEIWIPEGLK